MRASSMAGFTLLEILVALVVFGLLMVGLTQGVQFGLHARDMQARMLDTHGALETTDRVLRNLVEQMDPGTPDRPATVVGTGHSLSFATTLPNGATELARQPVEAILLVDGAHRLLLRWTSRLHAIRLGPAPGLSDSELLDNIDHVDFAYWEKAGNGGGQWLDSWRGSPLPALVRIRFVFAPGDHRHWPEMIVAPMRQPSGN
jgi:general secretion pathway protein J